MKQLGQLRTSFRIMCTGLATLGLAGLASAGQASKSQPGRDHTRAFFWKEYSMYETLKRRAV